MRGAAFLVFFAAACGHERATLIAAHVTGGQGNAQEAVEEASGTLECPDELFPQELGSSDPDGDLRAQHIGALPMACTVTISKAGFRPYQALLRDVCGTPAHGGCRTAELRVVLAPDAGKGGPESAK
jgi:hypothetical protein